MTRRSLALMLFIALAALGQDSGVLGIPIHKMRWVKFANEYRLFVDHELKMIVVINRGMYEVRRNDGASFSRWDDLKAAQRAAEVIAERS